VRHHAARFIICIATMLPLKLQGNCKPLQACCSCALYHLPNDHPCSRLLSLLHKPRHNVRLRLWCRRTRAGVPQRDLFVILHLDLHRHQPEPLTGRTNCNCQSLQLQLSVSPTATVSLSNCNCQSSVAVHCWSISCISTNNNSSLEQQLQQQERLQ